MQQVIGAAPRQAHRRSITRRSSINANR